MQAPISKGAGKGRGSAVGGRRVKLGVVFSDNLATHMIREEQMLFPHALRLEGTLEFGERFTDLLRSVQGTRAGASQRMKPLPLKCWWQGNSRKSNTVMPIT